MSSHITSTDQVSKESIYRYVAGGLLRASNIDMPRVCRTKSRKSKSPEHKVDSGCRVRPTYMEFLAFMETSDVLVVEMDSVIGRIWRQGSAHHDVQVLRFDVGFHQGTEHIPVCN